MYFVKQKYIVIEKKSGLLHVETNSGHNWFLFFVVFILLFNAKYIMYPGILLCFIIWTYKKEWIIKISTNELICNKYILWIVYEQIKFEIHDIKEIGIKRIVDAQAVGYDYNLYMKFRSGESINVTRRSRCIDLRPIVNDFRFLLPESVIFAPHEDYFKEEEFIRFD